MQFSFSRVLSPLFILGLLNFSFSAEIPADSSSSTPSLASTAQTLENEAQKPDSNALLLGANSPFGPQGLAPKVDTVKPKSSGLSMGVSLGARFVQFPEREYFEDQLDFYESEALRTAQSRKDSNSVQQERFQGVDLFIPVSAQMHWTFSNGTRLGIGAGYSSHESQGLVLKGENYQDLKYRIESWPAFFEVSQKIPIRFLYISDYQPVIIGLKRIWLLRETELSSSFQGKTTQTIRFPFAPEGRGWEFFLAHEFHMGKGLFAQANLGYRWLKLNSSELWHSITPNSIENEKITMNLGGLSLQIAISWFFGVKTTDSVDTQP